MTSTLTQRPAEAGKESQANDVVHSLSAERPAPAGTRTRSRGIQRHSALGRVFSLLALAAALLPPLYLFSVSLMGRDETVAGLLIPAVPRWENYGAVFADSDLPRALVNSVLAAVLGALLSLAAGVPAAWAVVRFGTGGKGLRTLLLSPWLLPPIVAVVPLFVMLRLSGLSNTLPGLILVYALVNIPVVVWLAEGFLRRIPVELLEAAALDGAGEWRILARVVLPLVTPALIAIGIIVGLLNYHEFLLATFLTQGPESRTAPVVVSLFYGDRIPHAGRIAAAGVVAAVPAIVLSLLVQRRLVAGLTAGASR